MIFNSRDRESGAVLPTVPFSIGFYEMVKGRRRKFKATVTPHGGLRLVSLKDRFVGYRPTHTGAGRSR